MRNGNYSSEHRESVPRPSRIKYVPRASRALKNMEARMIRAVVTIFGVALLATAALANDKPTNEEAVKVKAALAEWGCESGIIEKETEGTGLFEVDDAKCRGMQYDLKFDGAYKLISMTRD